MPASFVLVVCLFVPQVTDCHGHVRSAFDTNTAPFMIGLALLGVMPILWRWRELRPAILTVTGIAAACLLITSVLGIPVLVVLALSRRMTDEETVALCGFTLVLAFVLVFPIAMLFGDWRRGGELTWAAAWLELLGMIWWGAAASDR